MMEQNTRFIPVITTEVKLADRPKAPGYLYFTSDTGKMYLDIDTDTRISVGGSGSGASVFYIDLDNIEKDEKGSYMIPEAIVSEEGFSSVGDIIINKDGSFYRIYEEKNGILYCEPVLTGRGASIWYIDSALDLEYNEEDDVYYIKKDTLLNPNAICEINDLIINANDGTIYRIVDKTLTAYECRLMALAGGSGGDTTQWKRKISVSITPVEDTKIYINKKDAYANITVNSGIYADDSVADPNGQISVEVTYLRLIPGTTNSYEPYLRDVNTLIGLNDGQTVRYNFGAKARESSKTKIQVVAIGANSGKSATQSMDFTTTDISLSSDFNSKGAVYPSESDLAVTCNVKGSIEKIIDLYFDDEYLKSASSDKDGQLIFTVPKDKLSHGFHKVKFVLYQDYNGERKIVDVDPVEFEIAVRETNNPTAIVWLGDYQNEYFNYEDIRIPYYIYDPEPEKGIVTTKLLKNNIDNQKHEANNITSGQIVSNVFEITDATEDMVNNYSVVCVKGVNGIDSVSRPVSFKIVEDTERDMKIQQESSLRLLFNSKGRSNDEVAANRESWSYNDIKAIFSNFNWYNNGWIKNEDEETVLRISNGASFSIPIGKTIFGGQGFGNISHTFEFQFKIRNVQSYENLINNITRYKGDSKYYEAFYGFISYTPDTVKKYVPSNTYFYFKNDEYEKASINSESDYTTALSTGMQLYIGLEGYKTKYTNYDAFLKWYCDEHYNKEGYDWVKPYDELTNTDSQNSNYDYTQKIINLSNLACGYYSGSIKNLIGFGLGPQDAFFTNGVNTVSASYVENKLINLTITYNNLDKLISIYVNGVLTGVISSTINTFTVNSDSIVFNSNYCDIDLYKMRVYTTPLTINEVVTNYAVDRKNVIIYDQNVLVDINDKTKFDFNAMLEYNEKHPQEPIMPYIVFDTSKSNNGDRLSWSKKQKVTIGVEFVNTVLDAAYASGELTTLAGGEGKEKDYYLHHCPSWKGENISMAVQGTSSEFYPRRNYKLKTKDDNKKINMTMHRGPYAEQNEDIKWFYMDNDSVGTTKFTMKIDFMESSGSYNRGLANLVGNAYSHHPLYYYNKENKINKQDFINFQIIAEDAEYNKKTTYFYKNHKGNIKPADGSETDGLKIASADDFAKGPIALAADQGVDKVLALGTKDSNTLDYANGQAGADQSAYVNKWMTGDIVYKSQDVNSVVNLDDLRTNVQGFPVLAFHKKSDGSYTYIGRYNMLTDKGSDETFGFKVDKAYMANVNNKPVEEVAECWEFENNSRGFCSFRDPLNRKHLSFNTNYYLGEEVDEEGNPKGTCTAPGVVEDFEYRYHVKADSIDIIVGTDSTRMDSLTTEQKAAIKKDTGVEINNVQQGQDLVYDLYGNWEKAVQWVWSTCLDAPFVKKQEEIDILLETEKKKYLIEEFVPVEGEYNSNKEYYIYERHLYNKFTGDAEAWTDGVTKGIIYELIHPTKTYGDNSYIYDSYEYRYAKFQNELEDHFNLDYLATYFVVTEVLELYDSRGKNCMMASWGPIKEGGEYIWFPVFYDMDTQLGINNTGIPSFDFSINATEEGCFSTNDSVLWNNFYTIFKNQVIQKYCQLKGQTEGIGTFSTLPNAPFASVNRIEAWYESDPTECNSVVMRGQRPLSAINLDEYYKYIAITTKNGGGYLGRDGSIVYDNIDNTTGLGAAAGTYFYALQGDRSLSRIQFLTNRLNYIDSWFTVGNYERGGEYVMRGRITANNVDASGNAIGRTSDKWIATEESPYFDESGNKNHEFDGEYWVTMTPSRKSYVTLGEDGLNYGSKPYINNPVKFEITKLENGIKNSPNYSEQLTYFYGVDTMKSYGNLHNLYFTELYFDHNPEQLTDLILGWDGLDAEGNKWFNHETNRYSFKSMPLLQELNLSNVQYKSDVSKVLDFTASEKLQNFRATGSNFEQIDFAPGVALDTLYLPSTLGRLELVEARQLKRIVSNYETPKIDSQTGKLSAKPGLYLENFTDYLNNWEDITSNNLPSSMITNLTAINIINAENLGYDIYKLIYGFAKYRKLKEAIQSSITITNINCSPYKLVTEGMIPNDSKQYFLDNGHYGFTSYTPDSNWDNHLKNGILYIFDDEETNSKIISNLELFDIFEDSNFKTDNNYPNITGVIYIDNDSSLGSNIDEFYIRNTLQPKYPNLKFFFKNLDSNYTAKFILVHEDNEEVYDLIGTQTIKNGFFADPLTAYGDITSMKPNYDFYGWSTEKDGSNVVRSLEDLDDSKWKELSLDGEVKDYTFYAIFRKHIFTITFHNGDNESFEKKIEFTLDSGAITAPTLAEFFPYKDDSELDRHKTYKFSGWALSEGGRKVDLSTYSVNQNRDFYAVFEEISVYDNVNLDNFKFEESNREYIISAAAGVSLRGKITIPNTYKNLPVKYIKTRGFSNQNQITGVFFANEGTNIEVINNGAFDKCINLRMFEFPSGLLYIYGNALSNNKQLELPDFSTCPNLKLIGSGAFGTSCTAITHLLAPEDRIIKFPSSLQTLEDRAFNTNIDTNPKYDNITVTLVFGEFGNPSQLDMIDDNAYAIIMRTGGPTKGIESITIYSSTITEELLRKKIYCGEAPIHIINS